MIKNFSIKLAIKLLIENLLKFITVSKFNYK